MKYTPILVLFLFLFGCGGSDYSGENEISFYHWKSTFDLQDTEAAYLEKLKVKKLYVRFFDVKWVEKEKEAYPFSNVTWNEPNVSTLNQIVPVVYITNESLMKTSSTDIKDLAGNISRKITSKLEQFDEEKFYTKEIQIDCDWSMSTKQKYFDLMAALRENIKSFITISATIRLHQVKFFEKTGVPPMDKGVLMFYNMGKVGDETEKNSILDIEIAKKYMVNFDKYPMPLDVALPLFGWGVQFRNGKVVQLLNNLDAAELREHGQFEELEEYKFKVKESTYINGNYVYKNDEIRLEGSRKKQLKEAVAMVREQLEGKKYSFIFYHIDPTIVSNHPAKEVINILK